MGLGPGTGLIGHVGCDKRSDAIGLLIPPHPAPGPSSQSSPYTAGSPKSSHGGVAAHEAEAPPPVSDTESESLRALLCSALRVQSW